MRWFNTAGPCDPTDHYMLPASRRLPGLIECIDRKQYVILHAARQSGKTTALLALARELTAAGRYVAVMLSVETGSFTTDDPGMAEGAIIEHWKSAVVSRLPADLRPATWPIGLEGGRLGAVLATWAQTAPRPLVVFLDEVDALRDEVLISVLRQLRAGYPDRPGGFPQCIVLVGLRDVRDYVIDGGKLGTASPFNVKVESMTLADFTEEEVADLLGQHTTDTGQPFAPEALAGVWELSRGQPWLVNALAAQLVDKLVPDRAVPITASDVDRAKEILIARQDTHLDSLAERLWDPRIRPLLERMLAGGTPGPIPLDDIRFALDLGLVRMSRTGGLEIANPIYREVLPRVLEIQPRAAFPHIQPTWLRGDGDIDIDALLTAFLAFWRRNGDALQGTTPYREIAPQLVMMAFLDRVANGGGTMDREYAIGRGRIDLCLRLRAQTFAFELKTWRPGEPDPLEEGLEQLDGYLDGLSLATGWLVLFDQREGRRPSRERTEPEERATPSGRLVTVVRA